MLQYLINATAIWLMSLVLFEIFLRKESFHNYNRFYLLFTFLLGALLPLWQWQDFSRVYTKTLEKPLEQVITAKQNIIVATTLTTSAINWQQWLMVIYMAGILVTFTLLIIDILKMVKLYRKGSKSTQGDWTMVETGKEHAPFSFRHLLFIASRNQYSDAEWEMILVHEKRHTSLLHIIDLFLMQVSRIIFWFHPLVYIYNKRLLLVHEYQADNAAAQQPKVYGTFLVQQALLLTSPIIAHSFNRSPIKNRIVMLTRRSSNTAKIKMIVFIPLLLVCILCFTKNIYSKDPKKGSANVHVLAFGITDTARSHHITYDQALANLKLKCKEKGYEVTGFSISCLPDVKGGEYLGPYTIKESNEIQGMGLKMLKTLKEKKEPKIRIFIDDIKVKHNGKEESTSALMFSCTLE